MKLKDLIYNVSEVQDKVKEISKLLDDTYEFLDADVGWSMVGVYSEEDRINVIKKLMKRMEEI